MSEDMDTKPGLPYLPYNAPEDEDLDDLEAAATVQNKPPEEKPKRGRPPSASTSGKAVGEAALPEMAGGTRQIKRIKTMRPQLAEAIRSGLVMPVSQRAGHTVYRLVKHIANR